jgi:prepilin-type processing-associated H-X9-DG protein
VTKNTLAVGTEFIIEGYHAKDGTNKAVGRNFLFADGRRLFLGGSAPGAEPNK